MYLSSPVHIVFVHSHITTALWVTDAKTGKQYTVLETSTFNFDHNKGLCASYNAMLPEPKSEEENNFLDSLNAQTFPLGLNDKEEKGVWRWGSDSSLVQWSYWAKFKTDPNPDGKRRWNCVAMVRHYLQDDRITGRTSWVDIPCEKEPIAAKNLVCQKVAGMYRYEIKMSSIKPIVHIIR